MEYLKTKQNIAKIIVKTITCSGESFGPKLSSSKYLTKPAPV